MATDGDAPSLVRVSVSADGPSGVFVAAPWRQRGAADAGETVTADIALAATEPSATASASANIGRGRQTRVPSDGQRTL
ncbi:MAG: hypothetical protein ABW073_09015 [Acidimicrobiia bacterium]